MSNKNKSTSYTPIANYAIIGDCHTAALINKSGSIDWYCPGRFDNPAVLCKILDFNKGGYLKLCPLNEFNTEWEYINKTNLLRTEFQIGNSKINIIDFMPVYRRTISRRGQDIGSSFRLIKFIEGITGDAMMVLSFRPTFDYGRKKFKLFLTDNGAIAKADSQFLSLVACDLNMKIVKNDNGAVQWHIQVKKGHAGWIILSDVRDEKKLAENLSFDQCNNYLQETRQYWEDWSNQCKYRGPYEKEVLRSALTLKILTYEPTGAIVAAPTTSLPEEIGGVRNWDYHFSWLRDSALILYALLNVGYKQEAADYFEWFQQINFREQKELKLLYRIDGSSKMEEIILDNLEGYEKSSPVRIGNAASLQKQLDIYGELMNMAFLYFQTAIGVRDSHEKDYHEKDSQNKERVLINEWPSLKYLVEQACEHWQDKDNSIWEVRGEQKDYIYSKLMCWVAIDRGIKLAKEYSLDAPLEKWQETLEAIRNTIFEKGYNKNLGSFVQTFNSIILDASILNMPRVGFIPATDPKMVSTIKCINDKLASNGLVYRYLNPDALPGGEETFSLCSFWMVEALALSGQSDKAHDLFEHLIKFANELGLFSEEVDPVNGEFLGNFPQGFTHMALINAIWVNLSKTAKHEPEYHTEDEAERSHKAKQAVKEGYSRKNKK